MLERPPGVAGLLPPHTPHGFLKQPSLLATNVAKREKGGSLSRVFNSKREEGVALGSLGPVLRAFRTQRARGYCNHYWLGTTLPTSSFRSSPLLSLASVPSLRSEARSSVRREKEGARVNACSLLASSLGEGAKQGGGTVAIAAPPSSVSLAFLIAKELSLLLVLGGGIGSSLTLSCVP